MMIYKDAAAAKDQDYMPTSRGRDVLCLNCGYDFHGHDGWRCFQNPSIGPGARTCFSSLIEDERYLTQGMVDSLKLAPLAGRMHGTMMNFNAIAKAMFPIEQMSLGAETIYLREPEEEDNATNDWRAWAHNAPGDCACGIKREQCEFHR